MYTSTKRAIYDFKSSIHDVEDSTSLKRSYQRLLHRDPLRVLSSRAVDGPLGFNPFLARASARILEF